MKFSEKFLETLKNIYLIMFCMMDDDGYQDNSLGHLHNFCVACSSGNLNLVKKYIKEGTISPNIDDNYAIKWCSFHGYTEIVKYLLTLDINPAEEDNWAFRNASIKGHIDVVKLLLKDPRVNPADKNNYGFVWTCGTGNTEMVKLLLDDTRIDPIVHDYYCSPPLYKAYEHKIKYKNNNNNDILYLLSRHEKLKSCLLAKDVVINFKFRYNCLKLLNIPTETIVIIVEYMHYCPIDTLELSMFFGN